jgi:hypothetical protein
MKAETIETGQAKTDFVRTFLCSVQSKVPKEKPPSTRPSAALAKRSHAGSARTCTFGRSNSLKTEIRVLTLRSASLQRVLKILKG